jgi:hypothetical protein
MMNYLVVSAAICAASVLASAAEPAASAAAPAQAAARKPVLVRVKPAAENNRLKPGAKNMINPQPLPPKVLKPSQREE